MLPFVLSPRVSWRKGRGKTLASKLKVGRGSRVESRGQETLTPALSRPTGEGAVVNAFAAIAHHQTTPRVTTVPLSHRMGKGARRAGEGSGVGVGAVSYTHLT